MQDLAMDAARFDALSRAFVAGHSRRGVTRLLGGLAIAGSLVGPGSTETQAKHKHKKKHKKCAQAGQPTNKKHKQCCRGLVVDGSGVCNPVSPPPPPPVPT